MIIDEKTIEHISKLARLRLSPEERTLFTEQLSEIIKYVDKISELDTSDVKPAAHVMDISNVTRPDSPGISLDRSELERIAPNFSEGHFIVPRIIEGNE
jgi:aspartyl-tRNA(Asn)/glutamyl-tRNA(Gln) amidotransferase subunit C